MGRGEPGDGCHIPDAEIVGVPLIRQIARPEKVTGRVDLSRGTPDPVLTHSANAMRRDIPPNCALTFGSHGGGLRKKCYE